MVLVVEVRSAGWNETDMRDFARVDMLDRYWMMMEMMHVVMLSP
jgi:hypothetical protein